MADVTVDGVTDSPKPCVRELQPGSCGFLRKIELLLLVSRREASSDSQSWRSRDLALHQGP